MVKKSKLLAALDAHKGRDYKLEKQKELQKRAEKRKKSKETVQSSNAEDEGLNGFEARVTVQSDASKSEDQSDVYESDEGEKKPTAVNCQISLPQSLARLSNVKILV